MVQICSAKRVGQLDNGQSVSHDEVVARIERMFQA
jgi:hypothetical protein